MYYGEVAVPTADISRFLAVAEQFQVRGLVEDVPKVRPRCYSSLLSVHKKDQHVTSVLNISSWEQSPAADTSPRGPG